MMRFARAAAVVLPVIVGGFLAVAVGRDAHAGPALVTSPAGKEVAEILVTGNKVRATQDIVNVFGLRPEQKYEEEGIRAGTKRLYDKGWFTPNGIVIRTVERTDQKINVILEVSELTNFIDDIQYKGADHLSRTELDKLTGLKVRSPMSPHLNQQARLNILRKYQEDGRIHASVTLREGNKLEDRRVVFDIVEGPKVKIDQVDFRYFGPHESGIDSGRLREQLTISRSRVGGLIGGEYQPGQIDYDVLKLTEYYHALGFLDARISRELTHSADQQYVSVTFHVSEGKRYKVGRVQVSGNVVFPEKKLLESTRRRTR